MLTFIIVVAILYPIVRAMYHHVSDKGDQALREAGFTVPYRKGQQGIPTTRKR